MRCFNCGQKNHKESQCPQRNQRNPAGQQTTLTGSQQSTTFSTLHQPQGYVQQQQQQQQQQQPLQQRQLYSLSQQGPINSHRPHHPTWPHPLPIVQISPQVRQAAWQTQQGSPRPPRPLQYPYRAPTSAGQVPQPSLQARSAGHLVDPSGQQARNTAPPFRPLIRSASPGSSSVRQVIPTAWPQDTRAREVPPCSRQQALSTAPSASSASSPGQQPHTATSERAPKHCLTQSEVTKQQGCSQSMSQQQGMTPLMQGLSLHGSSPQSATAHVHGGQKLSSYHQPVVTASTSAPAQQTTATTSAAAQQIQTATSSASHQAQASAVDPDEIRWMECIRRSYPAIHTTPYFIPSVYQNRTSYTEDVRAGQTILIPQQPVKDNPAGAKAVLLESDTCDDSAQRRVLNCLQAMAMRHPQGMFILSQLQFGAYLNEPSYAAAASHLPRPRDLQKKNMDRGDFDILGIVRDYGFLVAEIKSIGDRFDKPLHGQNQPPTEAQQDAIVTKKLQLAIRQVDKSEAVVVHLVSDLSAKPRVTKVIMLPNISRAQLERIISGNSSLEQDLMQCLHTADPSLHCLTSDELSALNCPLDVTDSVISNLHAWWRRVVQGAGVDPAMTDPLYERLVARFCGPATEVTLRTLGEGVSHTGDQFTRLVLTPDQINILNTQHPGMYITGPPGTGKTILLIQFGLEWRQQGLDVHVVSCEGTGSLAASVLVHHQINSLAGHLPGAVHFHRGNKDDLVDELEACARASGGSLYIVADECWHTFLHFFSELYHRVPSLQVRAASMHTGSVPSWMTEYQLSEPLRTPPVVTALVQGGHLSSYGVSNYKVVSSPAPSDGPPPIMLSHSPGSRGHVHVSDSEPCEQCGRDVAQVLTRRLNVGQANGLRFRDVFVLLPSLSLSRSVNSEFVRGLQQSGVPVTVVKDDAAVRNIALMTGDDTVAVSTGWGRVSGLERKLVVCVTSSDEIKQRLWAMSRCTSQLVWLNMEEDESIVRWLPVLWQY